MKSPPIDLISEADLNGNGLGGEKIRKREKKESHKRKKENFFFFFSFSIFIHILPKMERYCLCVSKIITFGTSYGRGFWCLVCQMPNI